MIRARAERARGTVRNIDGAAMPLNYANQQIHSHGSLERIELTLNHWGLTQALVKADIVPEGFQVTDAHFEEGSSVLEITLVKEEVERTEPVEPVHITIAFNLGEEK
jgi:hypothetical protein